MSNTNRELGLLPVSGNFEVQKATPLDARNRVQLYSSLTNEDTWKANDGNSYPYEGMRVSVWNDTEGNNGIYWLKALPVTESLNWVKLSSSSGSLGKIGMVSLEELPDDWPSNINDDGVILVNDTFYTKNPSGTRYTTDLLPEDVSASSTKVNTSVEGLVNGTAEWRSDTGYSDHIGQWLQVELPYSNRENIRSISIADVVQGTMVYWNDVDVLLMNNGEVVEKIITFRSYQLDQSAEPELRVIDLSNTDLTRGTAIRFVCVDNYSTFFGFAKIEGFFINTSFVLVDVCKKLNEDLLVTYSDGYTYSEVLNPPVLDVNGVPYEDDYAVAASSTYSGAYPAYNAAGDFESNSSFWASNEGSGSYFYMYFKDKVTLTKLEMKQPNNNANLLKTYTIEVKQEDDSWVEIVPVNDVSSLGINDTWEIDLTNIENYSNAFRIHCLTYVGVGTIGKVKPYYKKQIENIVDTIVTDLALYNYDKLKFNDVLNINGYSLPNNWPSNLKDTGILSLTSEEDSTRLYQKIEGGIYEYVLPKVEDLSSSSLYPGYSLANLLDPSQEGAWTTNKLHGNNVGEWLQISLPEDLTGIQYFTIVDTQSHTEYYNPCNVDVHLITKEDTLTKIDEFITSINMEHKINLSLIDLSLYKAIRFTCTNCPVQHFGFAHILGFHINSLYKEMNIVSNLANEKEWEIGTTQNKSPSVKQVKESIKSNETNITNIISQLNGITFELIS